MILEDILYNRVRFDL